MSINNKTVGCVTKDYPSTLPSPYSSESESSTVPPKTKHVSEARRLREVQEFTSDNDSESDLRHKVPEGDNCSEFSYHSGSDSDSYRPRHCAKKRACPSTPESSGVSEQEHEPPLARAYREHRPYTTDDETFVQRHHPVRKKKRAQRSDDSDDSYPEESDQDAGYDSEEYRRKYLAKKPPSDTSSVYRDSDSDVGKGDAPVIRRSACGKKLCAGKDNTCPKQARSNDAFCVSCGGNPGVFCSIPGCGSLSTATFYNGVERYYRCTEHAKNCPDEDRVNKRRRPRSSVRRAKKRVARQCVAFTDSGERCPNRAVRFGKCKTHATKCAICVDLGIKPGFGYKGRSVCKKHRLEYRDQED